MPAKNVLIEKCFTWRLSWWSRRSHFSKKKSNWKQLKTLPLTSDSLFSFKAKYWLRGGVGGQFTINLEWSAFNLFAPGDFAETWVLKLVKWFSGFFRFLSFPLFCFLFLHQCRSKELSVFMVSGCYHFA